jgi:hypothetical protein
MAIRKQTVKNYTAFIEKVRTRDSFSMADCRISQVSNVIPSDLKKLGAAISLGKGEYKITSTESSKSLAIKVAQLGIDNAKKRLVKKGIVSSFNQNQPQLFAKSISDYNDNQLIAELKSRGYRILKVTTVEV